MRARTTVLITSMLITAAAVVVLAVEAVRTGRLQLGDAAIVDEIPDGFYGPSFLPDVILDNIGWIGAPAAVWIVVAALLVGREAVRGTTGHQIHRDGERHQETHD